MFSSNYLTQRNSQSCYENTLRPSLSDYNISSNNEQISQNNIFTQNPLIISQHSNMSNNSMRMQGTQQSLGLGSNNYINYKQFENIMIENVKSFPEQVSNYLTSSRGDISLRLLMNSIYSASLVTSQNFDKINNTFCAKLTSSNICVEKFLELCAKMNYLLNVIDNDLVNQFSLLTSFHGYDESIQNEEKDNIETIERVINECNELLFEKIIKPNQNSMNFNEEINQNCIELKNILFEEMNILYQNLNKLIRLRKEKNDHQNEYQQILDGVAEVIASLKDKFIFSNNKDMNNENVHVCEENKENNINRNKEADNKEINNSDVTDEVKIQKRLATIKIISEMNKRYKRKKKKYFK